MENTRSRWAAWENATDYKQKTREAKAAAVAEKRRLAAAAALERKRERYLKLLKKSKVPLFTNIEDRCYPPLTTHDGPDVDVSQINA